MSVLKDILGSDPKDCKDIYGAINSRQVLALMFHNESADLYGFMGLEGFKCMHEYQYLSESAEHREIKSYYLSKHDKILPEGEGLKPIEVVPDDWLQYTRMDVTPNVRKQHIERAMNQYLKWESDTLEMYNECARYLMEWGKAADFFKMKHLIHDVSKELSCLKSLYLKIKASDYSLEYIVSIQDELAEKYCCKSVRIEK